MKISRLILILIVVLASVLRLYQISWYPALNADEAALGYNAYSILETGQDEHGNPWPIHFQSFNDWKPGLYVYMLLPFIKIFGLTEFAVRVSGVLLAIATIPVVYLLVKRLFKSNIHALFAAFLLAINPWHLHFSRGGWEVNVATFFITLGVLLFVSADKNKWLYLASVISFVLAMYTYHAARVVIPLLGLALIAFQFKQVKNNRISFISAVVLGLVLLIPLVIDFLGPAGISRASGVGLFADPGPISRIEEQRGEHENLSGLDTKLLHNKAVNYSLAFVQNWADHFHGEFLFLSGDDIERNKVPETGQFYLFEIITMATGVIVVLRNSKPWKLILFWIIVAPFAAALTFQSPHALRAHNLVIPLTILSAAGLTVIVHLIKLVTRNYNFRIACYVLVGLFIAWNFGRYIHMYYTHMSQEYQFSSQYGLKELTQFINNYPDQDQKIVITDRYDQPYIILLFYLQYNPELFQQEHQLSAKDQFGFSTVRQFSRFYFEPINFEEVRQKYPNSLIVGTPEQIPDEANIIERIYGTNNHEYFNVVAN